MLRGYDEAEAEAVSGKQQGLGARTLIVCCFTTLGGLVFGFDTGVIGGVMLMDDFRSTMGTPLVGRIYNCIHIYPSKSERFTLKVTLTPTTMPPPSMEGSLILY